MLLSATPPTAPPAYPHYYPDYCYSGLGGYSAEQLPPAVAAPQSAPPSPAVTVVSSAAASEGGEDARARPFACPEPGCGRRFSRKFTLGEHAKTHSGERPYACPLSECGKRFSTSGNLARHKRLHKDIKPFDCPVATCQRTFPTEDKLRHHVKIHTGDKVHVCGVAGCHKTFSTAGNLTRHTKLHHPEVDPRLYQSPRTRPRRARPATPQPQRGSLCAIPAPAAASTGLGSPSGVDSMDQRLDRLLIVSPASRGPTAPPPPMDWGGVWPAHAPPSPPSPLSLPRVDAQPRLERDSGDTDDDPLLGDVPAPDAARYSLSLLDDVVEFQLTEAQFKYEAL